MFEKNPAKLILNLQNKYQNFSSFFNIFIAESVLITFSLEVPGDNFVLLVSAGVSLVTT